MSSSLNCIGDVKACGREFLTVSGLAMGAAAVPAWLLELEAAEAEAVDKGKLADAALSAARTLRASYADIRINRYRNENIFTREKQVQQVSRTQSFGCGVRVLLRGTWGFASSRKVTAEEVRRIPLQDKIGFLLKLNEAVLKVKGVNFINSSLAFVNEQKFFASSEGSRIEQYIIRSFPNFNVTAVDSAKGDFQSRRSLGGPQGMG